jgi:hypothetical protein
LRSPLLFCAIPLMRGGTYSRDWGTSKAKLNTRQLEEPKNYYSLLRILPITARIVQKSEIWLNSWETFWWVGIDWISLHYAYPISMEVIEVMKERPNI